MNLPAPIQAPAALPAELKQKLRGPMLAAGAVIFGFFGVFGAIAAFAPLASGAHAPGIISPEGSRRTIQHLEGGIVKEIYVRDGDVVEAGQPLVLLAETRAQAQFEILQHRRHVLAATIARLRAEQSGAAEIAFPPELLGDAPELAEVRAAQEQQFLTRRANLATQKAVLSARIGQLRQEIAGHRAQSTSSATQSRLLDQEIANVAILVEEGLAPQSRLLGLQRAKAQSQGGQAAGDASVARADQAIGEARVQMLTLDAEAQAEIADALDRAMADLAEVNQELAASRDVLERTTIAAPVSGVVIAKTVTTIGGVVKPGEPFMQIVPNSDDLVIEARVAPTDIDVVTPGLKANVHLTAFTQRTLPQVKGVVRSVSADALTDEVTGAKYFLAKVEVPAAELAKVRANLRADLDLKPGMPAEVLIETGERTLLAYLTEPLAQSMRRALREG